MKKLAILFGAVLVMAACKNTSDSTIHYTISSISENDEAFLKLKIDFQAKSDGETVLLFQDKAWGQDSLHNVLKSMKVLNAEATISTQRDSGWVVIKHPKNLKQLEFEYTLKQDTKGDLTTWDTYRPVITPEYFHVFSHNLLMLPKHIVRPEGSLFDVKISWEGFTEENELLNSFGSNQKVQSIENISEEELHTAVFVGGDFRVHNIPIEDKNIAFAIRGDWQMFEDNDMISILKKTFVVQRNFWQDHSQDYYAVTMLPTIQERGSGFQGSGLTNSFAVNATNNKNLEVEGLVYLFNHELQHNWTGTLIKNENEEEQYWFSEGFTDYYTLKNIAKSNIYDLDAEYFIKEFNLMIKDLYTSPVNDWSNSKLTYETFWSGQEGVQKLPYRRGALLAFYLDNKIQEDTNGKQSLDDVLLKFKEDAIANGQKITHTYFIETVNQYVKEDIKPFFDTHIEQGTLYDLEGIFTHFGYEYHPTAEVFDLGFEFSEDRKSIATIDETSNAYKAGLRAGDKVVGISYYKSTAYPAEFKVLRNGKEITMEYMPVKRANIPQLRNSEINHKELEFKNL